MQRSFLLLVVCWCAGLLSVFATGNYSTTYVSLNRQDALLYAPDTLSAKSGVAVVVMHSDENYMGFVANAELARRGYTVLATAPSSGQIMEEKLRNVAACVEYLRRRSDIRKIVLLGHSGGATVMTAYQLLAEQGRKALEGKIYTDYSSLIDHLPPADGLLLMDANYGLSLMTLMSLDPDVTDESTGMVKERRFDLTQAEGYNPSGSSLFTDAFESAFSHAQQQRFSRIVTTAKNRLALIKEGKGRFADDEPLVIPGGNLMRFYNKLFPQDLRLLSHTRGVWPLIHKDGSVTVDTVRSVRAPMKAGAESSLFSASLNTSVRGFLSSVALSVSPDFKILEDGFEGVEWTSNLSTPIGNVTGIAVPTLVMGMTGSWEYLAAEYIYVHSVSQDKSIAFVEGASHMFSAAGDAEHYWQADYGDTLKNAFDYVDGWLSQDGRFF